MCDSCFRKRLLLLTASAALGILVFALLVSGTLVPAAPAPFWTVLTASLAAALLLGFLGTLTRCACPPALAEAWSCWGELAVCAGGGAVLSACLISLSGGSAVLFHGFLSLTAALLALLLGALTGFFRRYVLSRALCQGSGCSCPLDR